MFNWGQIWTVCRPLQRINVIVSQEVLTNSGYMGTGSIVLKNLGTCSPTFQDLESGIFLEIELFRVTCPSATEQALFLRIVLIFFRLEMFVNADQGDFTQWY